MRLAERAERVMPPVAHRPTELEIASGRGCYMTTEDGEEILDFVSGIAVCNLGHNYPTVVDAAMEQMQKIIHASHSVVYYEPYVALAEKLVELTGGNTKVYYSNSGAEVVEGAIKLARYATGRPAIISFKGAFHGRTNGAASVTTSNSAYRKNIEGTLMPGVYLADYPYLLHTPYVYDGENTPSYYFDQFEDMFKRVIDPYSVAGILIELVQGEGGYIVPPRDFIQFVRELCDKYGIMMICDEIQTGFGRTGKMFAYEHFGIRPDIMTCAKGIANGIPLSALIARADVMDKWAYGAHGGTFGGNPVACAAALEVIKVLEAEAVENSERMGIYFRERLEELRAKYPCIAEVRGLGLMNAIELLTADGKPDTELTNNIVKGALERKLLLYSCGCYKNVIRFIPSLLIDEATLDKAVDIIDDVLATYTY